MDFKVKSQLLPLLFSGGMAAAQAQTVLQQDTHMFREGDVILKQEVQYKSPGRSGKNVVWDFSELTPLENEYRESYDRMDSLFTCSGMNATYQYRFSGDSLLCVGYFNQLLQVRHLLPELIMHYPLTYSDSICSFYYGEGKYSHTLNLAVYGETVRKADAEGILFLPDGEVLSDVLRVHESVRTGQRIASSPAILSFGETSSYSKDSLIYHLTHDSITWRVDAYRWYAPGYRYPVFETVQTFVCASGIPVRHFQRSYYYPVEEQKYLSEDRVNMAVRETLATQAERDEEELYTRNPARGEPPLDPARPFRLRRNGPGAGGTLFPAHPKTEPPYQTQRRSIRSIRRNASCLRFTARNGTGSPYRYAGITVRAARRPANMPVPSATVSSRCTR